MASLVCKKCLEDDPSRIDLITCKCFHESLHLKEPRVQVVLAPSNSRLERFIPPTFGELGGDSALYLYTWKFYYCSEVQLIMACGLWQ